MGDIGVISNQLRGLSDRSSFLSAEGLNEMQAQVDAVYATLGFDTELTANHPGVRIGAVQTNLLEILGDSLEPLLRITGFEGTSGSGLLQINSLVIRDISDVNTFYSIVGPAIYQMFGPSSNMVTLSADANGARLFLNDSTSSQIFTLLAQVDLAYQFMGVSTFSITEQVNASSASIIVAGAAGSIAINPTSIIPTATGVASLGSTTKRWLKLWVADIDMAGSLTASAFLGGSFSGNILSLASANLGQVTLSIQDASGTTTNNALQLSTFGGTIYFKIIGGTDSGAPGTVVARDMVPFTDDLYKLANVSHKWHTAWINRILCAVSLDLTGAAITAPSGSAAISGTAAFRNAAGTGVATLTVSGGLAVGYSP